MGIEGIPEETKKAYEAGTLSPTLQEGANNPEAAPYLANTMGQAMEKKPSFEHLKAAIQMMSPEDKGKLGSILDKIVADYEANDGPTPGMLEKAQITVTGLSAVGGAILWLLVGGEAAAPLMLTASATGGYMAGESLTHEKKFKQKVATLRSLIQS